MIIDKAEFTSREVGKLQNNTLKVVNTSLKVQEKFACCYVLFAANHRVFVLKGILSCKV